MTPTTKQDTLRITQRRQAAGRRRRGRRDGTRRVRRGARSGPQTVRSASRTGTLPRVSAAFIFLMVILKIPIFMLLYIVWYAIKSPPEPEPVAGDDGGTKRPPSPHPRHPRHPRPAHPRHPRRGPHGAPQIAAPARTRTVVARARRLERHR